MTKDEALKMAIEAMNSAYSSHGKILTSMPAQDAWLYHGCDSKLFKALQACKDALEQPLTRDWKETIDERIAKDDAFKQALEQPAQEPVAYIHRNEWNEYRLEPMDDFNITTIPWNVDILLYTHPAPSWQGLSDDERFIIVQNADWDNPNDIAELIEQALKTKNG